MQNNAQTVDQLDKLAEQNRLLQELRELDKTEETTCSCDMTRKVKFLAGQTEPDVGRLEVVERRRADNNGGN